MGIRSPMAHTVLLAAIVSAAILAADSFGAGAGPLTNATVIRTFPKPPRGTKGLAATIGLNPRRPAEGLQGDYKGALVIGGRLVGAFTFRMEVQRGATVEATVGFSAFGWSTAGTAKTPAKPEIRIRISDGLGASIGIPSMSLNGPGGALLPAALAAYGRFKPSGIVKGSRSAFVAVGDLRFRTSEIAARFGGQDMGDYFGGQDMGDYFGGQDMGSYFGGQDMGSYFGGQDMGDYISAEDIATLFTGTAPEFGGQDMGDYFGGQDMGDFLTARQGAIRVGILIQGPHFSLPPLKTR